MPVVETAAVTAGRVVVGKALSPLSASVGSTWSATSNLGPNTAALESALLSAEAILDSVRGRDIHHGPLAEQLRKLRDLAYNAKDALDELDYFRIQDQLEGTHETADRGCFRDLVRDTRHTTRAAVSKLTSCCACASKAHPEEDAATGGGDKLACDVCRPCKSLWKKRSAKTAKKLQLNRVDLSKRMKRIIDELQPVCDYVVTTLNLQLGSIPMLPSAADRPKTAPVTEDPDLYGRDDEMKLILDGITRKFCEEENLTIIPIVGHGGIGKTTFAQHVYQKVKSLFQATIWICVSSSYNVNNLMREIKGKIPEVEDENKNSSDEELIQQRLKSKRFLLVLDDIWKCHEDEWKRLLAPFRTGEKSGNIVLVTTRIPDLVTKLGIAKHLVELKGLAKEPFEKYFLACVFGQQQQGGEPRSFVENIGTKIVDKLKGSPLAAKTVGRLLRGNLTEDYWTRVLESKEWELQTDDHDIIPALKLSYDYLPYQLQQCFVCCALFPEDYEFTTEELIHLWIGLDVLHSSGQNKRAEDIGHIYLNELVIHGFFNKVEEYGKDHYVIHDLLRDLALMIPSNECLSICYSNVKSVTVHPSVRHLSIIMKTDHWGGMTDESFIRDLRQLKKRLKVENLQTLMLFDNGRLESNFCYLFKEVCSLRVLLVSKMTYPVNRMFDNFSKLIHLRYLRLGSFPKSKFQLPSTVSRFYHLRILDLREWHCRHDFPSDTSNLVNLHYLVDFQYPYPQISMVGKLQLLRELDVFEVKMREKGFDLKELEPLMEIHSLGIYNLENVLKKEAGDAKLAYKNYIRKLTLHWGSKTTTADLALEAHILESLRPHSSLKELSIIGHGGYTCPTWLGGDLSVAGLEYLRLVRVEWKDFTPEGDLWLLKQPNLRSLEIENCENLSSLPPIPWTHNLRHVRINNEKSGLHLYYGNDDLPCVALLIRGTDGLRLDEKVLAFHNLTELPRLDMSRCQPLAEEHLRKLTSLRHLSLNNLDEAFLPSSSGGGDVKWQLPVEQLKVQECFVSGKNLTMLLYHFPRLSSLEIRKCKNITRIVMMVAEQEQTRTTPSPAATKLEDEELQQNQLQEIEEDEEIIAAEELQQEEGLLVLPPHLSSSLQDLDIEGCSDLILVQQGGLQNLCSLVSLSIQSCPSFLSAYASSSSSPFPSSVKSLHLDGILGMEEIGSRREGFWHILTQVHVAETRVTGSPKLFAGWETTCVQNENVWSCKLQDILTDDAAGFFTTPVCNIVSSSLTKLCLRDRKVVTFSEGQGNALQLLTSLQELEFDGCIMLEALPPCLDRLSKLERIDIRSCIRLRWSVQSLPSSLQVLNVKRCGNRELRRECSKLKGTIPTVLGC